MKEGMLGECQYLWQDDRKSNFLLFDVTSRLDLDHLLHPCQVCGVAPEMEDFISAITQIYQFRKVVRRIVLSGDLVHVSTDRHLRRSECGSTCFGIAGAFDIVELVMV